MTVKAKKKKKDRSKTIEAIILSAQKLLFDSDYSILNMETIAREAGVSKGTIFYYFNSKESLAYEVLKYSYYLILEELSTSLENAKTDLLEIIKELLYQFLNQTKMQIGITKLLLQLSVRSEAEVRKKVYSEICLPFYDEVEKILRLFHKSDAKIKSRLLKAIFDGLALKFYLEEELPVQEKIEDYSSIIFELFVK